MKKRNHYETLGVDKSADAETVKKAFRKRAKDTHPDKNAGTGSEEFRAVQRAYQTLSDEEARRIYDETGRDSENRQENRAEDALVGLMLKVIAESPCVDGLDLVKLCGEEIQLIEIQTEIALKQLPERATKVRDAIKRIQSDQDNFLRAGLEAAAAGLEASAETFQRQLGLAKEMRRLLEPYRYKFDKGAAPEGYAGPLQQFMVEAIGRMAGRRDREEQREFRRDGPRGPFVDPSVEHDRERRRREEEFEREREMRRRQGYRPGKFW